MCIEGALGRVRERGGITSFFWFTVLPSGHLQQALLSQQSVGAMVWLQSPPQQPSADGRILQVAGEQYIPATPSHTIDTSCPWMRRLLGRETIDMHVREREKKGAEKREEVTNPPLTSVLRSSSR